MTPYDEQTLSFDIADQPRRGVLRTPKELAERAGLLINLAADCEQSLDGECFRIVPEIFLAADTPSRPSTCLITARVSTSTALASMVGLLPPGPGQMCLPTFAKPARR